MIHGFPPFLRCGEATIVGMFDKIEGMAGERREKGIEYFERGRRETWVGKRERTVETNERGKGSWVGSRGTF